MKSLQDCVDEMNKLLGELIQVATQLRDMSLQVISEEDLAPLQKHQEDLLSKIEAIDRQIQENYRHQLNSAMHEMLHSPLQTFQQLNQEFIQNLRASHGLIQFEFHRLEETEEQDFSDFSHLNKILPSPDSSETAESKESEES